MASVVGHEDPSSGAGFGQSGQSFYNSRAVPRGGPRNARGMMNGYRGSSNGFRGIGVKQFHINTIIMWLQFSIIIINAVLLCHQGDMKATVLLSQMLPAVAMVKPNLTHLGTIPTIPTSG